jgi:HK97 family phage prohead protease
LNKINTKSLGFKIKANDEAGTFSAYGNVFGNVDHAGDRTMKGAFTKCIQGWAAKARMPRLLSQHGHNANPIGVITSMKEDEHGLLFEGKFCTESGTAGAEAYALVKMGALDMFSIGYNTIKQKMKDGINELHELDVMEISLVTFACNEESLIQSVKSALDTNENPLRGVQKALQAAGISKRQAQSAVTAIKEAERLEESMKSEIEVFKLKASTHVAGQHGLETKNSTQSLSEYAAMIRKAVRATIETEGTYAYVIDIYMDSVIVEICEYTENDYKEYCARVSYSVASDSDVMVGTPEVVVKHVMWLNPTEEASMSASMSSGYKAEEAIVETKEEEVTEVITEEEEVTEVITEEEEVTEEVPAEEVTEKSVLNIDDIKSLFL